MRAPGAKGHCGDLGGWAGLGKGKRQVDTPARSRVQEGLQTRRGVGGAGCKDMRLSQQREVLESERGTAGHVGSWPRCRPTAPRVSLLHCSPAPLHR